MSKSFLQDARVLPNKAKHIAKQVLQEFGPTSASSAGLGHYLSMLTKSGPSPAQIGK